MSGSWWNYTIIGEEIHRHLAKRGFQKVAEKGEVALYIA
jgi:predicted RNA binding protein YcfA (HicA-like mRNA interferase family)